ncbi:MAG: D-2-hydroxyacid dehydrogenase, partial [Chloroflexi bacterium]|nr:D-2-hydroxyacid dehydrogenase [Chloroflexota bacterium]
DLLTGMKRGAFILDCSGRPSLYDYGALERALESGQLGGVCLQPAGDSPGMPPDDSAFWKRDNVVVTTCRGTSSEQENLCIGLFFDNLRRFESERPLLGMVDKAGGY